MIYYKSDDLVIRGMRESDADIIYKTYKSSGWHPNAETYQIYLRENESGRRITFSADWSGELAGHVSLIIKPDDRKLGPFSGQNIPLVSDFSVFYANQKRGIGSKLLDILENEARKYAPRVCLAVGVHSGYGAAHRLYIKRGYIPDGSGVWWNGSRLGQYEKCVNDDDLLLWLSKDLDIIQNS